MNAIKLRANLTKLDAAKIDLEATKWAKFVLDTSSEEDSQERLEKLESCESLALDFALMVVAMGFECARRGSQKRSDEIMQLVGEIGAVRAYGKFVDSKKKTKT